MSLSTVLPSSHELVVLPSELRGYVRYIVVMHPEDNLPYSIGIRHVRPTRGVERVLQFLAVNRGRSHKKSVQAWLCPSVVAGQMCFQGHGCDSVHVTEDGYHSRRLWTQTVHPSRTITPREDGTFFFDQNVVVGSPVDRRQRKYPVDPITRSNAGKVESMQDWLTPLDALHTYAPCPMFTVPSQMTASYPGSDEVFQTALRAFSSAGGLVPSAPAAPTADGLGVASPPRTATPPPDVAELYGGSSESSHDSHPTDKFLATTALDVPLTPEGKRSQCLWSAYDPLLAQ